MRCNVIYLMLVSSLLVLSGCYGGSGGVPNKTNLTLSVRGTITSKGTALSGVTVKLAGRTSDTATTDERGNFSFTGVRNGRYTITPVTTGYIFDPKSLPVTINAADVTNLNFTATLMLL